MSYNNFIRPEIEYLSLRLFILRIREDKKKPTYRIAYGVIVPSDHTMEKASVSEFSQLGRYGNKVYLSFITMCFALGKGTIIYGIRRDIALLYEGRGMNPYRDCFRESCSLFRVPRHRTPSSPIYLSEVSK